MDVDWGRVVYSLNGSRADNYDEWVMVGMALSSIDGGFELWDRFSQASPKYKAADCVAKWKSFKPGIGITHKSLIHWAKEDNPSFEVPRLNGVSEITPLTESELRELETRRIAQEEQERQAKLSNLELLKQKKPHSIYHERLMDGYHSDQLVYFMDEWGFNLETIDHFRFGYCRECPTSPYSDSFTIPFFWQQSPINLRHRLLKPNGQGKYRPEMVGLSNAIFNANVLRERQEMVVMVEGEFKAAQLVQQGFTAIGLPGANAYKAEWNRLFTKVKTLYIAFDPGADKQAIDTALTLAPVCDVRVASFPVKPDDFFVNYGGSVNDFYSYLQLAEPVK